MQKVVKAGAFLSIASLVGLFKTSMIIGSITAFFSGINIVTPLAGAFGGSIGALGFGLWRLALFALFGKVVSFKYLAFVIPGMIAGLYWRNTSALVRVAVPLVCMALFIAHPVGMQAFAYSFYWLIPVGLYFLKKNSTFAIALGSTFTAHAVGSVIWLYAMPMSSAVWYALIPIVALERLFFATAMTVTYKAIQKLFSYVDEYRFAQKKLCAVDR